MMMKNFLSLGGVLLSSVMTFDAYAGTASKTCCKMWHCRWENAVNFGNFAVAAGCYLRWPYLELLCRVLVLRAGHRLLILMLLTGASVMGNKNVSYAGYFLDLPF